MNGVLKNQWFEENDVSIYYDTSEHEKIEEVPAARILQKLSFIHIDLKVCLFIDERHVI